MNVFVRLSHIIKITYVLTYLLICVSLRLGDRRRLPTITPTWVDWSFKAQDMRQPTVSLMSARRITFRSCNLYR